MLLRACGVNDEGNGPEVVVVGAFVVMVEEDLSSLLGLVPSDTCERNS